MGHEQPPSFYDGRMVDMSVPLEEIRWAPLYETVANMLPEPAEAGTVCDLGCGTGRFAELIRRRGYTDYWGVDFSPVRVAEAQRYVPQFSFEVGDLFDRSVVERFAIGSTFVVTEVLEHVDEDLELLASLPGGSKVVLSVPSYDSEGHTRSFSSMRRVLRRYGQILDLSGGQRATIKMSGARKGLFGGRRIFVISGLRP